MPEAQRQGLEATCPPPPRLSPGAISFAHMLAAVRLRDASGDIVRNGHHFLLRAVPVGLATQFFHYLHQMPIVAGNLKTTPNEGSAPADRPKTASTLPDRLRSALRVAPILAIVEMLYGSNRTAQNSY